MSKFDYGCAEPVDSRETLEPIEPPTNYRSYGADPYATTDPQLDSEIDTLIESAMREYDDDDANDRM